MSANLWRETRLLINGALVASSSGATFDNINPATEDVIGTAADGTTEDMDTAIGAARLAFDNSQWGSDHKFRATCLRQLHAALVAHADDLRQTTVAEVGCPVSLTYGPQLDGPVAGVAWVADLIERYEWEADLGIGHPFGVASRRFQWREPVGVVGAITAWNFPHQLNLAKLAPALAAGNTVILKPAPDTPFTTLLLGKLIAEETDIPRGVVNIVTSSRHEVGAQLATDPRIDLVSFTGSTATGRRVMTFAATTVKRVFLELGGKSAAIVLDDADLETAAASAAFQITAHAGQGCAITSRWLVPRARHDEAVALLVKRLAEWPYGDPTDPKTMMGPLIREGQRQRVLDYIAIGQSEGGEVALGGGIPSHLPKGFYVEPTVIVGVQPDDTIAQEEIFGPVLAIIPHDGDDHAVEIANNSIYGLSGAVYSGCLDRARAVARRIRTGTIGINGGICYGPQIPFGGYRQSGIGRECGVAGFEEYLEVKVIAEPA